MNWLFSYPRLTLCQLLVLMAFFGFICLSWIYPRRSLFSPPRAITELAIANRSPLAAVVSGGSVAIIECPSGNVRNRFPIKHHHAPMSHRDWRSLPVANSHGGYQSDPGNVEHYSVEFSENDRFIKVWSYGHEPYYKSIAVTVFEIATGRKATWNGVREDNSTFPDVTFDAEGAKIHANGKVVANLDAPGSPPAIAREHDSDSGLKDWKIWSPEWETFFDQSKLVKLGLYNRTDERSPEVLIPVGDQGEASLVVDEWGTYYPALFDSKTGELLPFQNPSDPNSDFAIESIAQAGYFVTGRQTSTPHDKLGSKEEFACWSIKTGRHIALPSWADIPMYVAWNPEVREYGGNLLVTDGTSHLTWIDIKTGATRELVTPWRFGFFREVMAGLWVIAWFAVTRKADENDYSRALGYWMAVATTLAILPPSFDVLAFGEWRFEGQWFFTFGCLLPLLFAILTCAIRRTASLPLITMSSAFLALLIAAWIFTEQPPGNGNTKFAKIRLTLKHDLDPEEGFDFFRPWRFGKPKPDRAVHFQFRDKLK